MPDESRRAPLIWAWAWTALILGACWFPRSWMPVHEAGPKVQRVPHLDKVVHFTMFLGFGLLWMRAVPGRRGALGVLAGGFLLAVVSELGQAMPLVNRDPGLLDTLADLLGLVAGMAVAAQLSRRWKLAEVAQP